MTIPLRRVVGEGGAKRVSKERKKEESKRKDAKDGWKIIFDRFVILDRFVIFYNFYCICLLVFVLRSLLLLKCYTTFKRSY